jgi:hypothetical protein
MLRVTALLLILIATQRAGAAEDNKQDTVEVRGKSLTLSCAEWKRNPDRSWTSTGSLLVGTDTVPSVTLRGPKETKSLEAKCGGDQPPVVTPTQSADPTRHAGHRHHSSEPGEGM